MSITENTFGTEITSDDIVDTLGFFDDWEERYKYIIDLGKELPAMDDKKKNETKEGSFYGYKEKHDNFYPGLDD